MHRRWLVRAVAAALFAAVAIVATGGPAQASTWREIPNYVNHKCLDNATDESLRLQIWNCTGGSEQQWQDVWYFDTTDYFHDNTFQLQNSWKGHCMNVPYPDDFVPTVRMGACLYYDDTQFWKVYYENNTGSGWYQVIQNMYVGWCLELSGNSSSNGTLLHLAPCDASNPAQQWALGKNLPFPGGVTVPNVISFSQTGAVNAINAAGLTSDAPSHNNDCASPGAVEVQSPPAGSVMSPGLVVHLTISTCTGGGGGGGLVRQPQSMTPCWRWAASAGHSPMGTVLVSRMPRWIDLRSPPGLLPLVAGKHNCESRAGGWSYVTTAQQRAPGSERLGHERMCAVTAERKERE